MSSSSLGHSADATSKSSADYRERIQKNYTHIQYIDIHLSITSPRKKNPNVSWLNNRHLANAVISVYFLHV